MLNPSLSSSFPGSLSSVAHLMSSNAPPSDEESKLIHKVLKGAQMSLKSSVYSEYNPLLAARHVARSTSCLFACRSILAPLRRVPAEVLGLIFVQAAHLIKLERGTLSGFPVMCRVSRLWKSVALSTPALWSSIDIDFRDNTLPDVKITRALQLCLQRSRLAPLDISLHLPPSIHTNHPAIELLTSSSDVWEKVTIYASHHHLEYLENVKGRLRTLSILTLTINATVEQDRTRGAMHTLFEDAPSLCEVYLQGEVALGCHFKFPVHQLTKYTGPYEHICSEERSIHAKLLVELQLTCHKPLNDFPARTSLDNLESLRVDFRLFSRRTLFTRLSLPKIREIHIINDIDNPIPQLCYVLKASSPCLLEVLKLHNSQLGKPGELLQLLSITPELRELSIQLPPWQDLSGLANPGLVPKLTNLNLIADSISGCVKTLQNIARMRCEPHTNLTEKTINIGGLKGLSGVLAAFTIDLKDDRTRTKEREFLEAHRTFLLDSELRILLEKLASWRNFLNIYLTDAANSYLWSKVPRKELSNRILKIDEILTSMATYAIQDVQHLYISRLHITLHRFIHYPSILIAGNRKFAFQDRGRQILDDWSTCLLQDLSNRRWSFTGPTSIKYIRKNSEVRVLEPLKLIYGLN